MTRSLLALTIGFILDFILGDPQRLYHPIRLVGNLIGFFDKHLNKKRENTGVNFSLGVLTAFFVMIITVAVPCLILLAAEAVHPNVRLVLESIMCWQLLATKSLKVESMKVYKKLVEKDLPGSRFAVSMIVGRDTQNLDETGITKAAVETVAENTSDGIIAPLFYTAVGGPILGWWYKSINTMDSMVGYKNDRYMYFGRFAAKLDDVVNFLPSRISACLMVAAAFLMRFDGKNAWKIYKRDRFNHASPNSAQTEAVMAGALGIQLAGDAWYFGKLHKKQTIGDALRPVEIEDIVRANQLLYGTAILGFSVFAVIKVICTILI